MTKTEIKETIKKWQDILGLTNWGIDLSYDESDAKPVFRTIIVTDTHPEYCLAEMSIKDIKSVDERDIVHEMLHILISEFTDYAYSRVGDKKRLLYFEERVVSQLTNIILRGKNERNNHKSE